MSLPKISVSNKVFTEDAIQAALNNPEILPGFIKPQDLKTDLDLYHALDELVLLVHRWAKSWPTPNYWPVVRRTPVHLLFTKCLQPQQAPVWPEAKPCTNNCANALPAQPLRDAHTRNAGCLIPFF
ncbi:hypothetical protein LWM68_26465 [Niabella sp. W65]|nr:hypothetical protein [Niabella sp. W65]MCH7366001.1 hypothetical protein [Niabella sp. W65]